MQSGLEYCPNDKSYEGLVSNENAAKNLVLKTRPDDYRPIFLGNLESYSNSMSFAQNAPDFPDLLYGSDSVKHAAKNSDVAVREERKRKRDEEHEDDCHFSKRSILASTADRPRYFPSGSKDADNTCETVVNKRDDDSLTINKAMQDSQSHKLPCHSRFSARIGAVSPTYAALSPCHVSRDKKHDTVLRGHEMFDPGVSNLHCRRSLSSTNSVPSMSPLSPLSPISPFSPTTPIPMYLPLSNSSCSSLHFQYHGCSFPSPCCQKYPLCYPPQLLGFRSEKNPVTCQLNAKPNGYVFSKRDEKSWNSLEKVSRDYETMELVRDVETEDCNTSKEFEYRQVEAKRANKRKSRKSQNDDGALPKIDENDSEAVSSKRAQNLVVTVTEHDSDPSREGSGEESSNVPDDNPMLSDEEEGDKQKIGKRKFTCKFCGKIYVSLGALKMHIRTHTLPCKCNICGKAFSRPWLLQGHIRTHTGEKPYKCHMCQRAFADRSNLRAHLQTHSDVKKYSCRTCHKTFSRMSLLVKHEEAGCLVS